MTDYEFPKVPEIENAYRAAYAAFSELAKSKTDPSEVDLSFPEVLSWFSVMLDRVSLVNTAQLGPEVSWQGPPSEDGWDLIVSKVDMDNGTDAFDVNAANGSDRCWRDSPMSKAAYAYKRACNWDFPPGDAGVWLLMLAPTSAIGEGDDDWFYSGRLVGFLVAYDRDEDGEYESVGHIWTAAAWRRRGIARRLLNEAKSRFPITTIEGPYSKDGNAFLSAQGEGINE